MRWVVEASEFEEILLRARTCVYIDSARETTALARLTFDDAEIRTHKFADLLQKLMEYSSDQTVHCIVLDPDPVYYFHRKFNKYPALEIAKGDSSDVYLKKLHADPGDSPVDAIGTNWWAFVIVPVSLKWFVHALRSDKDDGGHLWIPRDWVNRILEFYPSLTPTQLI
jgi:hypothetical protein